MKTIPEIVEDYNWAIKFLKEYYLCLKHQFPELDNKTFYSKSEGELNYWLFWKLKRFFSH